MTTYAIVSFFVFFFSRPFHENFKFLKNCPYDFQKILHSHSTPKGAPACGKASKSYDWNVRNIPKIGPKMARVSPKTAIFRLFSIRTKFSTVILHHIRVLYVQWHQNFLIFAKTVHTIRTKTSTVIFYTIVWSYVCNFNKFVKLGLERVRRKKT